MFAQINTVAVCAYVVHCKVQNRFIYVKEKICECCQYEKAWDLCYAKNYFVHESSHKLRSQYL